MKSLFRFAVISAILSLMFSCVSTSNVVKRVPLFSFLSIDSKTKVVPTKEKLIAGTQQVGAFADIKQTPQEKIEKIIKTIGIDTKKVFKNGETLRSFTEGKVIDVDTEGSTAWGKYILIEGTHNYFLSDGEKKVPYRLLICYLADIAAGIKPTTTVYMDMALGTVQIQNNSFKSTNILLFTPDTNDVFFNFSTPNYPVDYKYNRWFSVYALLNINTRVFFAFPEENPHEAAYEFCHWHDPETGEERRDPPPPNYSSITYIQSGIRFSLLIEKKPYILTSQEQNTLENQLGFYRSEVNFGELVSVTTWKDNDYTYYLFWGPKMNQYIQEEWDPKTPVLISAAIITADVATNSIVFYVAEFFYKALSEKLDMVEKTVIKLED